MPERLSDIARRLSENPSSRWELDASVLVWEEPTAEVAGGQTLDLTRSGTGTGRPVASEPLVFVLRKGSAPGNAFAMGITVGRTGNNDIVLGDRSVSRFHAYFIRDQRRRDVWKLVDADSKNGTWVGGVRLRRNGEAELEDRARLRFGEAQLLYLTPESFLRHIEQHGRPPP